MVSVAIFSTDPKHSKFESWTSENANHKKIASFLNLKSFFAFSQPFFLPYIRFPRRCLSNTFYRFCKVDTAGENLVPPTKKRVVRWSCIIFSNEALVLSFMSSDSTPNFDDRPCKIPNCKKSTHPLKILKHFLKKLHHFLTTLYQVIKEKMQTKHFLLTLTGRL